MTTILVLEDDFDLRNLYTRALSFKGYTVQVADCAENALELLDNPDFKPDAAVLDMSMPGLPGSAVVDFIRNQSLFPDLPIIVISCDESFKYQLKPSKVNFLAKPINLADLYNIVAKNVTSAVNSAAVAKTVS